MSNLINGSKVNVFKVYVDMYHAGIKERYKVDKKFYSIYPKFVVEKRIIAETIKYIRKEVIEKNEEYNVDILQEENGDLKIAVYKDLNIYIYSNFEVVLESKEDMI